MGKHALKFIGAILIIPTMTLLGLMWWPLNPLELKSVTILNEDKRVVAGGKVVFEVHYVKHTDMAGKVVRQLINNRVINYAPHVSDIPSCEAKRVGTLKTNRADEPGTYMVNYTVIYRYFGFREVAVSKLSDEFELVAK